MPLTDEDTPLTELLRRIGVTHARDQFTNTDQCHALRASDGHHIGRYDAHAAWKNIDQIRAVASQHLLLPPPY